jgi:hypothetical protein
MVGEKEIVGWKLPEGQAGGMCGNMLARLVQEVLWRITAGAKGK